jgi:hypothetical protein
MKFAIMAWVSGQARATSIFGVLDKDTQVSFLYLAQKDIGPIIVRLMKDVSYLQPKQRRLSQPKGTI